MSRRGYLRLPRVVCQRLLLLLFTTPSAEAWAQSGSSSGGGVDGDGVLFNLIKFA